MRPFTDVLRDFRRGKVVDDLTEALAEVVKGVEETNKKGEITLKLVVQPQGKDDNAMRVSAKVTSKVPRADLPDALFYADADGSLLRDDPTQSRMFADAEEVDPKTGEIRPKKQGH